MKKLLLAATVATLAMNAAQAAPTLYGKLNVTLDQIDKNGFKDESVTKVNSNASRIGVKGEEKLTDSLSAVYLAEWGVSTDGAGSDADWGMRNRFVGIKSDGIATLKIGQFDSYLKTAAGNNQDIFNDHTELDMTKVLAGEDRLSNVIGFETDKKLLGGLAFNIMFQQGEQNENATTKDPVTGKDVTIPLTNAAVGQKGSRNGFGDGISTSITYENKDFGLAAAVAGNFAVASKYNAYSLSGVYTDAIRVTGSLDLKPAGLDGLVLGGLWQTAQPTDDTVTGFKGLKENAFGVTGAYAIPSTPIKLKAEYISAKTEVDGKEDRKNDLYGVGADYQINKQARFYGVVGQQKIDWQKDNDKKTTIGLGMEYNF
ncbi:porin [Acinetobacter sp. VNH17]|uniref:Porin n=2 Tax=Acinetobacter TaxID=469 RepID=A0ABT7WKC6_9GAMM|nr:MULTISPECIES: porin [Acinetobacter]MCY6411013.1 porin [Acinetobacter thutiue]MDM1021433.1 porin [Acinetobacter thutiue]MDN0013115.1 porin [Acinetobacter thutiue]WHP06199.1 porin [Acinetobacter sp. KCTC 92772]